MAIPFLKRLCYGNLRDNSGCYTYGYIKVQAYGLAKIYGEGSSI